MELKFGGRMAGARDPRSRSSRGVWRAARRGGLVTRRLRPCSSPYSTSSSPSSSRASASASFPPAPSLPCLPNLLLPAPRTTRGKEAAGGSQINLEKFLQDYTPIGSSKDQWASAAPRCGCSGNGRPQARTPFSLLPSLPLRLSFLPRFPLFFFSLALF